MINLHQEAKRLLLSGKYGKFDLVEKILPEEVLLYDRPRFVKAMICSMFELEDTDINYYTFISWLFRYRKRAKEGEKVLRAKEKKDAPDWKEFIPTVPEAPGSGKTKKLIKIVKPQNNDL